MAQAGSKRSEFKEGMIKTIRCKNFLTYRDVTINPGPRLNIVVGPNGTGKSSIVCAIAIGLGASPKILGRSDNLGEFVMQGETEGWVEVTIFREGHHHQKIRRNLTKGVDTSKFFLDDKPSTAKEISALVSRYGAQLANLCTFLPQEKVGEFSGFDEIDLLKETEKAVGGTELYENHLQLIELEGELSTQFRQVEAKKARVEELKEQNRALERDREKMEQREKFLQQAELCKKRLLWVEFSEKQDEAKALKEQKDAAEKALRDAEGILEPLKERCREAGILQTKSTKGFEEYRKLIDPLQKQQQGLMDKVVESSHVIEQAKDEIQNALTRFRDAEKKVKQMEQVLVTKQAALDAFDGNALKQQYEKIKAAAKVANDDFAKVDEERAKLSEETRAAKKEFDDATKRLEALGDSSEKRVNLLQQARGGDSIKLRDWLQKNRGSFRRQVHGPVALELNIERPEYLDVLEDKIGQRTLLSFVTECDEDYHLLFETIKAHRWNIRASNIELGKLKQARESHSVATVQQLQAKGMTCFLEEAVTCSDAVKAVLRDFAYLHSTVVGDDKLNASVDQDMPGMSSLFLGNGNQLTAYYRAQSRGFVKLSGGKSRYQDNLVSNVSSVRQSGMLMVGEDQGERQRLEEAVAEKKRIYDEAKEAERAHTQRSAGIKSKRDKLNADLESKRLELGGEKKLKTELAAAEKKLAAAQGEVREIDAEKERKVLMKKIAIAMNKRVEFLELAQSVSVQLLDLELRQGGARLDVELAKDVYQIRKKALDNEEHSLREKEEKVEQTKAKFNESKEKVKESKKRAEQAAPLYVDDGRGGKVDLPLRAELDTLPSTKNEVSAMLEQAEAAAAAIHHNPAVIRQYNERKSEIEELEKSIVDMEGGGGGAQSKYTTLKDKWERRVGEIATKLTLKFETYMKQLGNQGRVEIEKHPESHGKWGLKLCVSFREGQDPVPLKKTVQSGGERSVATIMYLMALQDMVMSPFRVVDEINQGMDERNERLVFRRIVENSVGPVRPQYFLITPKLLQGLTAMEEEDVTVLFVFNGPYNLAPGLWDLPKFFELKDNTGGKKTDSKRRCLEE